MLSNPLDLTNLILFDNLAFVLI